MIEKREPLRPTPPGRGLKYGMGFFETILVTDGKPRFLPEHLNRLIESCRFIGLRAPNLYRHILDEIASLPINDNNTISITVSETPEGYSLLVSSEMRNRNPYSLLGLKVTTVPQIRDKNNPLNRHKSCNYLLNHLVHARVKEAGFDEALFLNQDGNVTEGTFTNFFFIKGKEIITPPPSQGLLPGIFRAQVITALEQAGLPVDERPISYSRELSTMDAAFVTNSLIPLERIFSIDGRRFAPANDTFNRVLEATASIRE